MMGFIDSLAYQKVALKGVNEDVVEVVKSEVVGFRRNTNVSPHIVSYHFQIYGVVETDAQDYAIELRRFKLAFEAKIKKRVEIDSFAMSRLIGYVVIVLSRYLVRFDGTILRKNVGDVNTTPTQFICGEQINTKFLKCGN